MENTLKEFGLTDNEFKTYVTLLELGESTVGPLVRKVELHRATLYDCLRRLIEKGLVNQTLRESEVRYFEAIDPDKLLTLLKAKEKNLKKILPELKKKQHIGKIKQDVKVYYGVKSIITLCESILEELNPTGRYYDFGVSGFFRDVVGTYWDTWQAKKKKYNIKSQCIFNEELKEKNPKLLKDYVGEYRFHPKKYNSLTDTITFKDKVVLFIWTAQPPLAVCITNKDNARSYKNQFNFMWKYALK